MMDAWLLGVISNEKIYFMTKGTFFNSKLKMFLLKSLGLIPINRAIDGKTKGVSNGDSFESCYRILEQGKTLAVFPEGNSFPDRFLRKLKSGTARIALESERRNNGGLGVKIIPIGLNYSQAEKFRSDVYIRVGEAISPLPYLELYKSDTLKSSRDLTNNFYLNLKRLLIAAESKEQENPADKTYDILSTRYIKRISGT